MLPFHYKKIIAIPLLYNNCVAIKTFFYLSYPLKKTKTPASTFRQKHRTACTSATFVIGNISEKIQDRAPAPD